MNEHSLIDYLEASGYWPEEASPDDGRLIYELIVSGTGTVRLIDAGDDGTEVYAYDRHMVERWTARFTDLTPEAAVIGTLAAAEDELAAERGGPVTSRQEAGS
jgi:hypothetical protein